MINVVRKSYPNFQVVATTLRKATTASVNDWSAVCAHGDEFCAAPTRKGLEIYDRVGGGDSFASGLAYGFIAGQEVIDDFVDWKGVDPAIERTRAQFAVECGAAHGALAMTTPGDTSMAARSEVIGVMKGGSARVVR